MELKKCLQCDKIIEPGEEIMHVETHCTNLFLCSRCIQESREYWMARMDEVFASEEEVRSEE